MGASGFMFMPDEDPTRLIMFETNTSQPKLHQLNLTTVPLTVEKAPIEASLCEIFGDDVDPSHMFAKIKLQCKDAKALLVRYETLSHEVIILSSMYYLYQYH